MKPRAQEVCSSWGPRPEARAKIQGEKKGIGGFSGCATAPGTPKALSKQTKAVSETKMDLLEPKISRLELKGLFGAGKGPSLAN